MCIAMPWLANSDVGAAYGFARSIVGSRTEAELQRHALEALAEPLPADVLPRSILDGCHCRSRSGLRCRRARPWSASAPAGGSPSAWCLVIRMPCCLEEVVAEIRADALDRLGLTARESEVLRVVAVIEGEAELAWELFLSLHAVRERLARLEAKLEVHTAGDAVARALRESL